MAAMARNSISHGSALFFVLLVSPFLSAAKRNKRKEKKSKKDVIITNAHFFSTFWSPALLLPLFPSHFSRSPKQPEKGPRQT
jgi:hypothetical protein